MIVGAAKSGTTSLADYLKQHPEVYFSDYKEPNYFALAGKDLFHPGPVSPKVINYIIYKMSLTDYESYAASYDAVDDEKAVGDASVRYLYYPDAPQKIRDKIPDVKIVVMLRDPVGRLYSHYCMNVQYQIEPLGLMDALAAEQERIAAGWGWDWHYASVSRYSEQIKRYLDIFDESQLAIYFYDDFVKDPVAVYQSICRHIGVDDTFVPDMSERGKVASYPRNKALGRWLSWPSRTRTLFRRMVPVGLANFVLSNLESWNAIPAPKLDNKTRNDIGLMFRDDLIELEAILGRKTPWLV